MITIIKKLFKHYFWLILSSITFRSGSWRAKEYSREEKQNCFHVCGIIQINSVEESLPKNCPWTTCFSFPARTKTNLVVWSDRRHQQGHWTKARWLKKKRHYSLIAALKPCTYEWNQGKIPDGGILDGRKDGVNCIPDYC